ncbi:MAG: hypothetical protein RL045_440 [Bacteroidota bacterium]
MYRRRRFHLCTLCFALCSLHIAAGDSTFVLFALFFVLCVSPQAIPPLYFVLCALLFVLCVSPQAIPTLCFLLCSLIFYFRSFIKRNAFYKAPEIIESTTPGSNNVDVSPKLAVSPSATLRRMRRMILPERVLGNPVTN